MYCIFCTVIYTKINRNKGMFLAEATVNGDVLIYTIVFQKIQKIMLKSITPFETSNLPEDRTNGKVIPTDISEAEIKNDRMNSEVLP